MMLTMYVIKLKNFLMGKLILGDGILASQIYSKTNWDFISRKKNNIDAFDFPSWKDLLSNYDIIINCIANTDTYLDDRKAHWDINYKFVSQLVDYCNEFDKKLVHISTDYVYTNSNENASEMDIPIHGKNWYSYTKLLADGYIELKSTNYLICRGSHKPKPFPYEKAWEDQIGNFDYIDVISDLIIKLINNNSNGLYNVGTPTKNMFELAKQTKIDIKPVLRPSNVPSNITMSINKLNLEFLKKEVVIAAYDRDYSWIKNLNKEIKITVYRKGNKVLLDNEIKIDPNIGRDVHTFFNHLYLRYDTLSDITYFTQDFFEDHVSNYIELMNGDITMLNKHAIEKIDNQCWFFNTHFNSILYCDNTGYLHDFGLNIKNIWCKIFDIESPDIFYFTPSGHFVITKEHARKIPREIYKKIIEILETVPRGPWEIERLESYIFIKNYKNLL
jgi:dTDP-4-dehydrorhamnose reductase